MELLQLKYFKAVADAGKISSAAAELFVSAPALSASISRLEKDLGVRLFDRSNNSIVLNKQGEIFLQYVNQIFTNLECARLDIESSLSDKSTTIRIAVTSSDLWLSLVSQYSAYFPESTLSITTLKLPQLASIDLTQQYSFLLADKSDIKSDNIDSVKLFTDYPTVMVPASHRLARRRKLDLRDLADEIIFFPMAEQSLNHRLKKAFLDSDFSLKHVNECASNICRYMVSEGRGISFSTTHAQETTLNNIRYIPLKGIKCNWQQYLFYHKNKAFNTVETQFMDFIVKEYSK